MDRCKNCGEGGLVKYGHRKYKDGKREQIYLCKCCNKVITEKQRHKKLNAEQKSRIDDMVNEGVGLRKIQRLIKVSNVNTVSNYLKKKSKAEEGI
jgi:transposase-like protein